MSDRPRLVVVAPAYEESAGIESFVGEVARVARAELAGYRTTLVVVDDGSRDDTYARLRQAATRLEDVELLAIRLSRNFGQQAALHAGLETAHERFADAAMFVIMDADLQHPPSLLPRIVQRLAAGVHHVKLVRKGSGAPGFLKRATSALFYRLFSSMSEISVPPGSSDFRGLSPRFVAAYLELSERGRFNRGLFHWLGFAEESVPYDAPDRPYGATKYSFVRMARLALVGLTQFSSKPLLVTLLGTVGFSAIFCTAYLVFELVRWLHGTQFVVGWPTIVFFVSFWGGLLALGQLMIGVYVARIFDEVKARPIYVVEEVCSPTVPPRPTA